MNELLGKNTFSTTSSPVKKKKKKSKKKNKQHKFKKTPPIAPPLTTPGEISITAFSVKEQADRLVKTFGNAGHPLRFKALSQKTGIPNTLLSLIVNMGQRAIQATIDKHPLLQQRFSSNFEKIMEEAAHSVISCETEKIGSSSTQSQQKTPIISVNDFTTPNIDIDQPETSEKSLANDDKQDSSNKSHHNKTRSSGSNTKIKNINKILSKAVKKIYVNNQISDDKKHQVKDIFIYDDVEKCCKIPFTFNHNEVNITLDWSYFPVVDKPKKSKNSDKTSIKVSPKTHEKISKPEKDLKKTSKNSKKKNKKKKKKFSDKKRNKNMDLIKFLLQFLN
ncbi:hypothetical protein RCL_jg3748.t1 [Rhizophagus clarus]|uniref:Uncharacterized protein n=1 Tax=Rhizophagus clarus TaxID=94130 RepID=A0A8H3QPK9_9GLOM|nr:hypothetical protein RCL_jg3748.t1 [Rhizophagus clarus]